MAGHTIRFVLYQVLLAVGWLLTGIFIGRRFRRMASAGSPRKARGVEIYVGNLPYDVTDKDLVKTFRAFGEVASARIIMHRLSGKSRGYGFVEMNDRQAAEAAMRALHGTDYRGRKMVVKAAK